MPVRSFPLPVFLDPCHHLVSPPHSVVPVRLFCVRAFEVGQVLVESAHELRLLADSWNVTYKDDRAKSVIFGAKGATRSPPRASKGGVSQAEEKSVVV